VPTDATSRIAVVTGASSGIGHDIAVGLAGRGHPVALVARSEAGLSTAAEAIRSDGGTAVGVPTDVRDAAAVEALRTRVEDALGPPSFVVNAAGVFGPIQLI
jgi:NADP-dependent 3-hydroxy acid dehydrogenase YdfG